MSPRNLKLIALALALIPIAMLAVLLGGELAGGNLSGEQHLAQIVPLAVLLIFAWKRPFEGGIILATVALGLAMVYPVFARLPVTAIVLIELFLFLPPLVAGCLFVLSKMLAGRRVAATPKTK